VGGNPPSSKSDLRSEVTSTWVSSGRRDADAQKFSRRARWDVARPPRQLVLTRATRPALAILFAALLLATASVGSPSVGAPIGESSRFDSGVAFRVTGSREGDGTRFTSGLLESSAAKDVASGLATDSTIPIPGGPFGLAYDPVNARLFIGDFGNSSLSVLDTISNQLVGSIPLTYGINDPVYDASNGLVYVADTTENVYEINATNLSIAGIVVNPRGCGGGCAPDVQAYDPANRSVYVVDIDTDFVSAIQNSHVIAAIPIGNYPLGVGYDAWNNDLYVANYTGAVVVDGVTNHVTDLVRFTGPADYLTEDTFNGDMFVDDENTTGQANVTVIDPTSNAVVATIPVGLRGGEEAFDPLTGDVYVALDNASDGYGHNGSVAVINGTSDRETSVLPVQQQPEGVAYDSFNHEVYVANLASGSLSLLLPLHRISFVESGLNPGTSWSVIVNNISLRSADATVSLNGANGPYQYSIPPVQNYTVSTNEGGVSLAGGNLTIGVRFAPVTFAASFQERGLPTNSNWSVTLDGLIRFNQDSNISFQTANGTFNFTVNSPEGFQASPTNGSIRVAGSNLSVMISFSATPGSGPPPSRLFGIPPPEAYALVGTVGGLLILIAAIVVWVRTRRVRPPPRTSRNEEIQSLPVDSR
jgi:YVTN family beta-propeller protein